MQRRVEQGERRTLAGALERTASRDGVAALDMHMGARGRASPRGSASQPGAVVPMQRPNAQIATSYPLTLWLQNTGREDRRCDPDMFEGVAVLLCVLVAVSGSYAQSRHVVAGGTRRADRPAASKVSGPKIERSKSVPAARRRQELWRERRPGRRRAESAVAAMSPSELASLAEPERRAEQAWRA